MSTHTPLARLACLLAPLALCACGQGFYDGRFVLGGTAGSPNGVGISPDGGNPNSTGKPAPTSSSGCSPLGAPLQIGGVGSALPYTLAMGNGLPSIAWGTTRGHYSAWTGAAWMGFAQSDTTGVADTSAPPGLVMDNGSPYLALVTQSAGTGTLTLYHYAGGQWTSMTPQPFGDAAGTIPQVDVNLGNGFATMTWHHGSSTSRMQQGLSTATSIGAALLEPGNALWVRSLPIANANDIVVWSDGQNALVGRYDGGIDVTPLGASTAVSPASGAVSEPVAAALMANGNPIVAWQDSHTGVPAIYVKAFDGTQWAGLGSSANAGGLTPSSESHRPALALDAQGRPWVAWEDAATQQVYLQLWNGSAWAAVTLPSGTSASGGGVSGVLTAGKAAQWPALGFNAQGAAIVSWYEAAAQVRVCALP